LDTKSSLSVQDQFAGLDLRQIQNVVDDGQQVVGCAVDLVQPLGLWGRDAFAP
jgi:hypothetical protein